MIGFGLGLITTVLCVILVERPFAYPAIVALGNPGAPVCFDVTNGPLRGSYCLEAMGNTP